MQRSGMHDAGGSGGRRGPQQNDPQTQQVQLHQNMNIGSHFIGINPDSAIQCADLLSLLDSRIYSTQQCMGDHELRSMMLRSIFERRAAVAQRLSDLNVASAGLSVVPRFTIKQLWLAHGAWTYQEFCHDRDESTELGNAEVTRLVEYSGLYPFEVHAKLMEINPVVFLEDPNNPLSIYVALKSSLREVVHALGGVLERDDTAEALGRRADGYGRPNLQHVPRSTDRPMTYQEYCATQDEMNARTNSAVRALSTLSGNRMDEVHAALLLVNPNVTLRDDDVVVPADGLRRVIAELSNG